MTNKHPYPAHIVKAVAREMIPYGPLLPGDLDDAERFLNALWDASRVGTIDDIEDVPEQAVVRDKSGFIAVGREHAVSNICYEDYPAHVIYWGNDD